MNTKRVCCKIGCDKEATKEQKIAFRNLYGYVIRATVAWCEDHQATSALDDFDQVDLLRQGGY